MIITNKLLDIIQQGGYAFMIPLLLMSILSLGVIIERLFALRKSKIIPLDIEERIKTFPEKLKKNPEKTFVKNPPTLLEFIISKALKDYSTEEAKQSSLESCLKASADYHIEYLSRRLWILNAIGNLAPLLGLLGTVVGLSIAFEQIGVAGLSQESVASGIAMALITTITGLSIAIPTLFALYGLRALGERRLQTIKHYINQFMLYSKLE